MEIGGLLTLVLMAILFWEQQQEKIKGERESLLDKLCQFQDIHPDKYSTLREVQRQFSFPISKFLTQEEIAEYKKLYYYQHTSESAVNEIVAIIRQRDRVND